MGERRSLSLRILFQDFLYRRWDGNNHKSGLIVKILLLFSCQSDDSSLVENNIRKAPDVRGTNQDKDSVCEESCHILCGYDKKSPLYLL